jgi:hypothetical protein
VGIGADRCFKKGVASDNTKGTATSDAAKKRAASRKRQQAEYAEPYANATEWTEGYTPSRQEKRKAAVVSRETIQVPKRGSLAAALNGRPMEYELCPRVTVIVQTGESYRRLGYVVNCHTAVVVVGQIVSMR